MILNESIPSLIAIGLAEKDLEMSHGWRFLYTSMDSLIINNGLLILGYNPGGECLPPIPWLDSSDSTAICPLPNAYLDEKWRTSQLQSKFHKFMSEMDKIVPYYHPDHLLRYSCTSNFIPFCSSNSGALENKGRCIEFGTYLWSFLLPQVRPKVILCIGNGLDSSYAHMKNLLSISSDHGTESHTSVGRQHVYATYFKETPIVIIGIPHLSHWANHVDKPELISFCRTHMRSLVE